MANSAPDVGALLMYDFYSIREEGEEEEEEVRRRREEVEVLREEEEGSLGVGGYSIIPELFAALSTDN